MITISLLESAAVSQMSLVDFESLKPICPEPLLLLFQFMECIFKVFFFFSQKKKWENFVIVDLSYKLSPL